MDYNGFLFDDIASSKIETLQTIQNEALRTITGAFRTTNTNNLHIEANIPILSLSLRPDSTGGLFTLIFYLIHVKMTHIM